MPIFRYHLLCTHDRGQVIWLTLISLMMVGLSSIQAADSSPRERINLNTDWRFTKDDPKEAPKDGLNYDRLKPWLLPTANDFRSTPAPVPTGILPGTDVAYTSPAFNDQNWRKLDLPHDWGIEGPFDISFEGETGKLPWWGVGWYRKHLSLPSSDQGRRIFLDVDGAMSKAAVWCNGRFVGGWPYGYASWRVDLTPYVRSGSDNVIAIRLDNLPNASRWYPGSGIYRNVWLVKTAPVSIAHWGLTVTTPEVSASSAMVKVASTIDNPTSAPVTAIITHEIFALDGQGKPATTAVATTKSASVTLAPGANSLVAVSATVSSPKLWSIATPNRYAVVTTVTTAGKLVDRVETSFGIRTAQFTANNGFLLNGQRVPINGVCMHHDLGALGSAFNVRAAERQVELLKEMGCNAIRTSHNPPAPELLDICDRLGMVVMAELVDTWRNSKKPNDYHRLFPDWSEADLRALVRRDRNHPSVIMWSVGNEVDEQHHASGYTLAAELVRIAHEEDSTRPVSDGVSNDVGGFNGFEKAFDVFGFNYKPGTYQRFHDAHPTQPLYGSETASTISSRGEYLFPVSNNKDGGKIGFHISSYDLYAPGWAQPAEWEFKSQDEHSFVAGEFVWTGFDYLGEPTPFNGDITNLLNYHTAEERAKAEAELKALHKIKAPSRSSYFGILDLAGFKKDRFFLYQARWRPDLPMTHILPHWTWPERVGQVTPVHVYTSGDEAELFLNGTSLGRKKKGEREYRLRWDDVKYAPGEVAVVAYKGGKIWAKDVAKTAGAPAKLVMRADRSAIRSDGRDLSFITVEVQDGKGTMVPRGAVQLTCQVSGGGSLVAMDNGDPTDLTTFSSHSRKTFNGLALVIVRRTPGANGPMTVTVSAAGMQSGTVLLGARPE